MPPASGACSLNLWTAGKSCCSILLTLGRFLKCFFLIKWRFYRSVLFWGYNKLKVLNQYLAHNNKYLHYYLCVCMLSCFSHIRLLATLWTVAHQALLSMEFSRQEYWSGLPFPSPGDLPKPEIEPRSPSL